MPAISRPVPLLCWLRVPTVPSDIASPLRSGQSVLSWKVSTIYRTLRSPGLSFTVLHPVLLEYVRRRSSFVYELPNSLRNEVIQNGVNH